jgi:hypothetical protein
MLVGQLTGRTLYILVKADMLQFVLPIDLLGMGFEFLMYAIALFGFRILDPILMARQPICLSLACIKSSAPFT